MIPKDLNYNLLFKTGLLIPLIYIMVQIMMKYIDVGNYGEKLGSQTCLKTFIDEYIPFSLAFLVPYLLFLLFPLIGFLFAFQQKISATEIISIYIALYLLFLSCYLIYFFFPTTAECVMIRDFNPSTMSLNDYSTIRQLYDSSTPYNSFPSLHVAPVVFLSIFLYSKKLTKILLIFIPFAILASWGTVALKFHVFLDLIGGVLMGYYTYYLLYKRVVLKLVTKFLD